MGIRNINIIKNVNKEGKCEDAKPLLKANLLIDIALINALPKTRNDSKKKEVNKDKKEQEKI